MGLSTERKVFVGVLAVAGVALVIDRGLLGPSEAAATSEALPVASDIASPEAAPAATPTKPSATMAQVLMDRLSGVQGDTSGSSLSTAFSLEELLPSPEELLSSGSEEAEQPRLSLPVITPTAPDLPKLSALMPATNGGGGAVLNGKLVRVGDVGPQGFKLIEVRERSVVLGREGTVYQVEMPMNTRP
ncbi:MAG: hypothetical protein JJ916_05420 [Phycisphaerales bacterium]|nr:hypothetical protein [Phycisphaerales bacterium]